MRFHKMFDPILFYLTQKKSNTKVLLKPRPFKILPAFQSTYAGLQGQFRPSTTDKKTADQSKIKTVTLIEGQNFHRINHGGLYRWRENSFQIFLYQKLKGIHTRIINHFKS